MKKSLLAITALIGNSLTASAALGAADGVEFGVGGFDRLVPGFGHDTHGVENHDGVYHLQCLRSRGR